MSPTIVYDSRGRPVAAFGAAGGATIIAQVAKSIIAHLDWGLAAEAALAAPTIMADRRGVRLEAGTELEAMAAGLKALGHQNVAAANLPIKGQVITRAGTRWRAAADPRSEGTSAAHGR
jgi:gamma-glutamyltranspeptidase/glutathione hydrolase